MMAPLRPASRPSTIFQSPVRRNRARGRREEGPPDPTSLNGRNRTESRAPTRSSDEGPPLTAAPMRPPTIDGRARQHKRAGVGGLSVLSHKVSELAGPPRTRCWYRCTRSSKTGRRCALSWPHKGRAPRSSSSNRISWMSLARE